MAFKFLNSLRVFENFLKGSSAVLSIVKVLPQDDAVYVDLIAEHALANFGRTLGIAKVGYDEAEK